MTLSGAGGGGSTGGGKGGSGAARTPVTDKDNLRSTQYASLVDVLCEGEIEGLVNGNKSIYLNDTPIQNPDNSYNFDNVTVYAKTGTQSQDAIPIASEIASEKSVGVAVTQATPIVRTITNPDVDAVRITISVPQLQMIEDDGDITGSLFQIDIDVQYNGGGYQTKINEWVKGRTGDPWTRDYRVELNGAFPVDIRVSRENPDSNNPKITNAFTWQSYSEITYAKLSYPNTALVGLRVDAGQFSSIPSRKYRIRGRKIKLPSNATVDNTTYRGRVTYSGVWDGTFGAAQYSNDPAWCLWDLLHSSRAGFGDHIKVTDSDKWAFYAASQYCRELVPNGLGGMEPRFACNVNIQTQQDAYKLINDLCSVFRAMPYWAAGTLGLTQDRPADPAFLFNQSNVIDGIFNYSSSSQKNRPTVVTAAHFDLDTRDLAYETVESQALIEQYGVVRKEIEAVATTSRGQARRVAEWMLYSEWNEPEVVAFKTSVDAGVMVRPGMVIEIADPARAGVRHGGRIVSATQTTVVLDSAEGLPASMTGCELTLIMPTGIAETRPIASRSGATLTFAAGSGFTASANPLSPWNLSEPTVQTQLWRVLGMKEADGIEYAITAISHNPSKYAYIELDKPLEERDITNLNETPAAPASVSVEEVMYVERARARTKLVVSWTAVAGVTSYVLRWRLDAGNWEQLEVETNSGDVLDSKAGTYEIEVLSIGANLKRSTTATATTFAAEGNSRPPATPSGLVLTTVDVRILLLRWAAPEPDVIYGGIVQVRHSPLTTGASWTSSSTVLEVDGGALQTELPAMTGTYLVKFRDSAGNWSTSAASIASIYATPGGRVTVLTLNEISDYNKPVPFVSGPFSSRKDGVTVSGGALSLASGSLTGTYYLGTLNRSTTSPLYGQDVIDLGMVEDVYIKEAITATLPDGVTAQLFVSTTDGSGADPYQLSLASPQYTLVPPALQPAWTDWREAKNNYVRGRCFRFKLMLTRTSAAVNASITAYSIDLQMQTRTAGGNQTAATLAYNPINGITLPQYFPVPDSPFSGFHYAIDLSPSFVQITGGGGTATGMTAQVQPSTVYGKNIAYIQFRNSSNQITTPATFTWTVTGYGAENGTPIVSDDSSGAMTPAQMRKLDGLTPGTQATNIVQLDTAAKLPAVDGSQLLNIPGGTFTQGGTGAITQTVQAKVRNTVHVKDFGAVGNGTTDDTAAIQAAINYAQTLTGGTAVWFDGGIYRITASIIVSQDRILLRGSGGTRITRNGNFGFTVRFYNANRASWNPILHVGIIGIELISTGGMSSGVQLQLHSCKFAVVRDVVISNGWGGLSMLGCVSCVIDGLSVFITRDPITNSTTSTTAADTGIFFGYGVDFGCADIFVSNSNVWLGTYDGGANLACFANYGLNGSTIDGLWLVNVHIACSKLANYTFGNFNGTSISNVYANNCMSDHCQNIGVDLVGTSLVVSFRWGGLIGSLGFADSGLRIIAPCLDVQISGIFEGHRRHGIYISHPLAKNITISNFTIRNNNTDTDSDGDGILIGQGQRIAITGGLVNGDRSTTGNIVTKNGIRLIGEVGYSVSQVNISNVVISRCEIGFNITQDITDVAMSNVAVYSCTTPYTTNGNKIPRFYVSNCPGISPLYQGAFWAPGTIATGTGNFTSITVAGAAMGDFVTAGFDRELQGCMMWAYVFSANTVYVIIQNNTGSSKTFPAGTVIVTIQKSLGG